MKTFMCNESIIITIPIGSLKVGREAALMPENFHCVFKDNYKVLVVKGKPKPVGAAQATAGVFLFALGLFSPGTLGYTLPSVLFVVSGVLSYVAGTYANMHVAKLSFSLNIISFFWSLVGLCLSIIWFTNQNQNYFIGTDQTKVNNGIQGLIMSLLVVESMIALFLIFWLSKAICREHFNTLPTILLKEVD